MHTPAGLLPNEVIFLPLMAGAVNSVLLECWLRLCQHVDADAETRCDSGLSAPHPSSHILSLFFCFFFLFFPPPLGFCCFISLKVKPPFPLASLPAVPSSQTLISLNSNASQSRTPAEFKSEERQN